MDHTAQTLGACPDCGAGQLAFEEGARGVTCAGFRVWVRGGTIGVVAQDLQGIEMNPIRRVLLGAVPAKSEPRVRQHQNREK